MVPDKQRGIQIGLQLAHLLTYCSLRYIEILGGLRKTQASTGCFKGSQNIESWASQVIIFRISFTYK